MQKTAKPKLVTTPNQSPSSVQCPNCSKPNLGCSRVVKHPKVERIKDSSTLITAVWTAFLVILFIASLIFSEGGLIGRGLGWFFLLPLVPEFLIALFVRCSPSYRFSTCPYCSYTETKLLGR